MIKAADLPAVRARLDGTASDQNESVVRAAPTPVPTYPLKKLVLENGQYVVAEPTK
jgi:hypothetical protein